MRRCRAPARFVLAFAVAATGCSRCGRVPAQAPDVSRWVPADCELAVVVPSTGALGEKLKVLEGLKVASFLAQLQGFADAPGYAAALVGQLGVDVRSREALAAAGLDPAGGLAVAVLHDRNPYTVLATSDVGKLERFLQGLARDRLGAGVATSREAGGVKVTEFAAAAGGPARLGFVAKDGIAIIAAESAVAGLASYAALPEDKALSKSAALAASLSRLPASRDLFVYVPPASKLAEAAPVGGAVVAVALSPEALTLTADLPSTLDPAAAGAFQVQPGPDLLPYLPADAVVALRFSGDVQGAAPYWATLVGPFLARALDDAKVDVKAEVLANLKPGLVMALAIAPEAKLAAGMPALDLRRTNPFRYVHLSALAEVIDPVKGAATLDRLPALAPRFGAKIDAADRAGQRVFLTTYSQGDGVDFALRDNRVVAAAPQLRLDQLLGRLGKADAPVPGLVSDSALKAAFDGHALAAVVDLRQLSVSVRELPSEAWGVGGFAYKASTVRWLDATDDLRAVLFSVDAKAKVLQAQLTLRFQKK